MKTTPITDLLAALDAAIETDRAVIDTDRTFEIGVTDGEDTVLSVRIDGIIPRLIVNDEEDFTLTLLDYVHLWCYRRSVTKEYRQHNRSRLSEIARDIENPTRNDSQ